MAEPRRGVSWTKLGLGVVLVLVGYLLAWPVPIDPVKWTAPDAPPLEGPYALNEALAEMELIAIPGEHGPEDIAQDAEGRLYVGVQSGKILRYPAEGGAPEMFAETGGRPLGLDFDNSGNLIVADAFKGLLSIDPSGVVKTLCTEAGGVPFGFTDDVDVDANDVAWFSDASFRYTQPEYRLDVFESRPNGRLLKHDLNTGECTEVLKDLYFANGIAVSPDGRYLLINETTRYRVLRYWIKGERAGTQDVFIENLPGFPDGISTGQAGIFWLAFATPRNPDLDSLSPRPWLRKVIFRLPQAIQPQPTHHPFVLGLSESAQVVYNLQDPDSETFHMTTSAQQHGDWLYVGSLKEPAWGRIRVSSLQ